MAGRDRMTLLFLGLRGPRLERAGRLHGLGPLAITLGVVMGMVLLLGPSGANAARTGALASRANDASRQVSAGAAGQASRAANAPLRIARADAHAEYIQQGQDLELNLSLTQTQNDCEAPLNGGVCLRYSVVANEQGILVGYGVIPASAVQVTAGAIKLRVNTAKIPGFTRVMGPNVLIVATWQAVGAARASAQQRASTQGAIGAYALPSVAPASGASVAASGGTFASMVATMIVR